MVHGEGLSKSRGLSSEKAPLRPCLTPSSKQRRCRSRSRSVSFDLPQPRRSTIKCLVQADAVLDLPANRSCFDCGETCLAEPWVSVQHGSVICGTCAATHRRFGAAVSAVLSLYDTPFDQAAQLSMRHGGNARLAAFLAHAAQSIPRHVWLEVPLETRYFSPAAERYRQLLRRVTSAARSDVIVDAGGASGERDAGEEAADEAAEAGHHNPGERRAAMQEESGVAREARGEEQQEGPPSDLSDWDVEMEWEAELSSEVEQTIFSIRPPPPPPPPPRVHRWTKDCEATMCELCSEPFSLWSRRHHCRRCRSPRLPLPLYPDGVRIHHPPTSPRCFVIRYAALTPRAVPASPQVRPMHLRRLLSAELRARVRALWAHAPRAPLHEVRPTAAPLYHGAVDRQRPAFIIRHLLRLFDWAIRRHWCAISHAHALPMCHGMRSGSERGA